jgi:hypothetical protein
MQLNDTIMPLYSREFLNEDGNVETFYPGDYSAGTSIDPNLSAWNFPSWFVHPYCTYQEKLCLFNFLVYSSFRIGNSNSINAYSRPYKDSLTMFGYSQNSLPGLEYQKTKLCDIELLDYIECKNVTGWSIQTPYYTINTGLSVINQYETYLTGYKIGAFVKCKNKNEDAFVVMRDQINEACRNVRLSAACVIYEEDDLNGNGKVAITQPFPNESNYHIRPYFIMVLDIDKNGSCHYVKFRTHIKYETVNTEFKTFGNYIQGVVFESSRSVDVTIHYLITEIDIIKLEINGESVSETILESKTYIHACNFKYLKDNPLILFGYPPYDLDTGQYVYNSNEYFSEAVGNSYAEFILQYEGNGKFFVNFHLYAYNEEVASLRCEIEPFGGTRVGFGSSRSELNSGCTFIGFQANRSYYMEYNSIWQKPLWLTNFFSFPDDYYDYFGVNAKNSSSNNILSNFNLNIPLFFDMQYYKTWIISGCGSFRPYPSDVLNNISMFADWYECDGFYHFHGPTADHIPAKTIEMLYTSFEPYGNSYICGWRHTIVKNDASHEKLYIIPEDIRAGESKFVGKERFFQIFQRNRDLHVFFNTIPDTITLKFNSVNDLTEWTLDDTCRPLEYASSGRIYGVWPISSTESYEADLMSVVNNNPTIAIGAASALNGEYIQLTKTNRTIACLRDKLHTLDVDVDHQSVWIGDLPSEFKSAISSASMNPSMSINGELRNIYTGEVVRTISKTYSNEHYSFEVDKIYLFFSHVKLTWEPSWIFSINSLFSFYKPGFDLINTGIETLQDSMNVVYINILIPLIIHKTVDGYDYSEQYTDDWNIFRMQILENKKQSGEYEIGCFIDEGVHDKIRTERTETACCLLLSLPYEREEDQDKNYYFNKIQSIFNPVVIPIPIPEINGLETRNIDSCFKIPGYVPGYPGYNDFPYDYHLFSNARYPFCHNGIHGVPPGFLSYSSYFGIPGGSLFNVVDFFGCSVDIIPTQSQDPKDMPDWETFIKRWITDDSVSNPDSIPYDELNRRIR